MDFKADAIELARQFDLPNGHFGEKDKITLAQALQRAYEKGREDEQADMSAAQLAAEVARSRRT